MTNYCDNYFLKHININEIEIVFEVGARYGDETLMLNKTFPNSQIYTFECNPNTVKICKNKLSGIKNVNFFPIALGNAIGKFPFYSYKSDNDGASSLFKRIDFSETQKYNGDIEMMTLFEFSKLHGINKIDLLCMDVQGFELNVLKGASDLLKNINYIIMEEPKPKINTTFLPDNTYSKYIGSPTPIEIESFMKINGFKEIERIDENEIEDNVLYKKVNDS